MIRHLLMTADAVGGVWQYAAELARALVPHGWRTSLLVGGPPPTTKQRSAFGGIAGAALIETDIVLDWLASDKDAVLRAGARTAELTAELGADLVHLNSPALAAAGGYRVPVVTVLHSCVASWWRATRNGPPPEDFVWRTTLVAQGLCQAAEIVVPSRAFGEVVQQIYGLRTRPRVVHNGRTPLTRQPLDMADFAFTAGRLWDAGKNAVLLDQAAARLPIPFKAAGPVRGPQDEVVELDNLALLGSLDESALAGCLAARPVFVSAARYEPFGLAVLEAASAGCALLLSDIATFRELWQDAALFVPDDDADAVAAGVARLIDDRRLRLSLGSRAAAAARRYTPASMAEAMATLYAALLATPTSAVERKSAA
ncbi:glycosyltransferase family 4 protein [Flavisphingomonas formosensis]|uniref:glycosyltransferase family 4 protein n=1 Tax=Flavisphingomonas formosensis TaxID=861534 RepID=UPI0012FAC28F|nr:glycosyltransferase family 4 protein [Sphingomonas formosensis]